MAGVPSVFDYQDYKKYLHAWIANSENREKGLRTRLSAALKCRPAYISHVLNAHAHLSPDQAFLASDFLRHDEEETQFFMNLVHIGRASSPKFQAHLREENRRLLDEKNDLQKKIKSERVTDAELVKLYYQNWQTSAIHMAVNIKRLRYPKQLAQALSLPIESVEEVLKFLVRAGLVKVGKNGDYLPAQNQIHIPPNSAWIAQHHLNWRLRCVAELPASPKSNLHYSSVISICEEDAAAVRQVAIQAIENIRSIVRNSNPDEAIYAYSFDFYRLSKAFDT